MSSSVARAKANIQEADFQRAATRLGWPVASIKAVCEVEAPRGGFNADGTPVILFERHHFHRHTGGRWSKSHAHISNATPGGYGKESAQHGRLAEAAALSREAALKSASWGRFQIMGSNYRTCGFETVQKFINAMYRGEVSQLDAFVAFNLADPRLVNAGRTQDWATYARVYNGPNYRINRYDEKLAAAFKKHADAG